MDLFLPEPTRYDLNFRLFSVPVRVSAGFWAVHLSLGILLAFAGGVGLLVLWPACSFVSVMVHELGHVLMGRAFGSHGEIILTPFGGLAGGAGDLHERRHRIAVYAAGPAAQLLLAGALGLVLWSVVIDWLAEGLVAQTEAGLSPDQVDLRLTLGVLAAFVMLIGMNVAMPLFNLLPVGPLDGAKILEELGPAGRWRDHKPWEQDPDWWKRR
jgi:Zn-dependent protease